MQLAHVRQAPGLRLSVCLAAGLLGLCTLCVCGGGGQSGAAAWPAVGEEGGGEGLGQRWGGAHPPSSVTLSTTEPVLKARMSELPSALPPRPLSLLRPVWSVDRGGSEHP